MLISFFEEFPTRGNLAKAKLITWPAKLYIAAPSVKEFKKAVSSIKKSVNSRNIQEFIYWPILKKEEGYWISPFSSRNALDRIFRELEEEGRRKGVKKIPVMLDLELPTTQNPLLYFTQLPCFPGNKRRIRHFMENYPGEAYQCEYFPAGNRSRTMLEMLGLHYVLARKTKIIKMLYTSMHFIPDDLFREELRQGKKKWGRNFVVGLGVLVPGVMGNEKTLTNEQLARDLRLCKEAGVKEVIVYRLGGLKKEYGKVMREFCLCERKS